MSGQTPSRDPARVDDKAWGNADGDVPRLALMVNDTVQDGVFRGWPVLVRLEVWHPRVASRKAAPMVLGSKEGPWSGAVTLVVTNEQRQAQQWALHLASAVEKTLTLTATTGGELVWWLSPDETAQLPEGKYRLLATLDTTESPTKDGWKGKALSEPFPLHMQSAPAQLTEEQQLAKSFLMARYHVVRKGAKLAMKAIDEILKLQSNNIRGLAFKADLLVAQDKKAEAFSLYQQALDEYGKKYPNSKQPPIFLLSKQKALLDKLILDRR